MKILMLAYSGNSGLAYYSCQLCRELSNKGIDVTFFTNRTYHLEQVSGNFKVVKFFSRTRYLFFELPLFLRYVSRNQFNAIHFQSYIKYPEIDYLLWRHLRKKNKLILTVHDILPHEPRPHDVQLFKKIYPLFDALIVHSEGSKDRVSKEFNIDSNKIFVIPHGIYDIYRLNDKLTQADARRKLSIDKDNKTILFFGHVNRRKGLESLLNVFSEISEKSNTISLLIAGSGSVADNRYYLQLIEQANKRGKITYRLDYIPFEDVQNYFVASDFVVLPYVEGSTSGVLKLAYAFDKPVISTNIGDLSEMMKDGETGYVIPASNEKVLKEMIYKLLDDRTAQTFSKSIFIHKKQFEWMTIAQQTIDVYRSIAQ